MGRIHSEAEVRLYQALELLGRPLFHLRRELIEHVGIHMKVIEQLERAVVDRSSLFHVDTNLLQQTLVNARHLLHFVGYRQRSA